MDEDGCLVWEEPVACPLGASCSAGVCRDDCEDDCQPAGQIECADEIAYAICGNVDADDCLEWSSEVDCIEGEVCLPEVGCAGSCPADLLEPNNGPAEAVFLGPGEYTGLIVCAGDDDWIGFDGVELGDDERLVVVLSFEHDRGDIDLVAYAGDGVTELARSDGALDGERLELRAGADRDTFLLRVFLRDTESNSNAAVYHLTLSVASGEGECTDGARRCLEDGLSFQKCGDFDGDGRTEWGPSDACGAFAICEGEGECLYLGPPPPEPGPDAGAIREAPEGRVEIDGCGCAAAAPTGGAAGRPAWLLLGLGLMWVLRRRGR
jgi:MYXO-CTERM domain-containing protein